MDSSTASISAVFSLPWYAAVGVNKALEADLPYIACILIGVVGPTAGRYFIDGAHPLYGMEVLYYCWLPLVTVRSAAWLNA